MKTNILSKGIATITLVCLILLSFVVNGQVVGDYRTKGTGALNWGVAANWERCITDGDWTGATSTTYPGEDATAGTVTILDGAVVTLNVSPTNSIASLAFANATATATSLTVTGQTLVVSGAITFGNPSANAGDQTLTIGTGTLSCASIDMPETDADGEDLLITISTGTLTVSGSLSMIGSANRNNITFSSTGTLNVGGDFSGGGFTSSTGTVNFNGTVAQNVGSYTYYNLAFTNNSIKTLQDDVTIGGNLTINSNATFDLGITATSLTVTGTTTIDGTLNFGVTSTKSVSLTGSLSGTGTIDMSSGSLLHTLNLGGATNTIGTLTTAAVASTINYNRGGNQTVFASSNYPNLSISGSGTKTLQGNISVNNDLDVLAGTFDLGSTATIVNISGNTNIDGILNLGSTSKATSISGSLTVDGTLNFGSAENSLSVTGNLVDVTGTITMQGAGLAHSLNLSGASNAIGTFSTTDNSGSIVNYNRNGAQTGFVSANYQNISLSGTGIKTFATTPTVKGVLSLEGDATVTVTTGVITYGANATLRYNTSNARTASAEEWITPFAATGGVIIDNTGEITLNASKTFNSGVPLTINLGATLNTSAANNYALTFGGNFDNNGTLTANASSVTINTTYTPQSIDGFTTTGTVSMTKTGGTATFQGNISAGALTINGSGGTLNLGSGLSHYISGIWTRTNGTLNGGSSTLYIAGSVSGTGGTFTAGSGTVNYNAAGNQNVSAITYNNLSVSGSGTKTAESDLTVNGGLNVALGCTLDFGFFSLFGTLSSIANSGTIKISDTSGTPMPTGKTWDGIVEYANTSGSQTIVGGTYENLTLSNTSNSNTAGGNLTINGTLTTTAGGTLDMGTSTILSGTLATIANNGAIKTSVPTATSATPIPVGKSWNGIVEYGATTGLQTIVEGTYNNLTLRNTSNSNTAGGDLTVNGTLTTTSGGSLDMGISSILSGTLSTITNNGAIKTSVPTATSSTPIPTGKTWSGTVEYGATAGLQTIVEGTYNNLTLLNTSNSNTAGGDLTVNGTLTTTSGGTLDMGTSSILSGTLATITNNGTIKTSVPTITSATPIPAGKTWSGTIEYGAPTGLQTIVAGTYNNLTLSNSSDSNTAGGNLTVNSTLTTTAGGTLDMGITRILSGTLTTITNNGTIKTSVPTATSSTPIPAGKTWSGTIEYGALSGLQTVVSGTYNNLTLDNTSGSNAAGGNITVNGTLNTTAGGTMDMGASGILLGTLSTIANNGKIKTSVPTATSSSPIPSGKTWSGIVEYGATAGAQTIVTGTYSNLTLGNTSGSNIASGNLTVNGVYTSSSGGTLATSNNINFSGTVLCGGSINATAGTATYGAAATNILPGTYFNIIIPDNSILCGNITVNGAITLGTGLNYNSYTISGLLEVSSVSATNSNGSYKIGDIIYVTIEFSKNVTVTGTPQLTLETGTIDRVIDWDGGAVTNTLTFEYQVQASDLSSDLDYVATNSLSLNGGTIKDASNNNADVTLPTPGTVNSLGANKNIVIDGVVPTLTYVHIQSNNATSTLAKVGDVITLTFTGSEPLASKPSVTIATRPIDAADITNTVGNTWTATYTMVLADATGNVPFTINFNDTAGNAGAQRTTVTDGSSVTFDNTVPTLSSVSIQSNNTDITRAKVGDIVTLSFTGSETLTAKPTVNIANHNIVVGNITNTVGNTWTATYQMALGDNEGTIPFEIDFNDLAGNSGNQVTAITTGTNVSFDKTAPTVSIASNKTYTNNNPFTLTITFNEDVKDFIATDVNVTYGTRGAFTATTPMRVWTLVITPDGGGNVQCSISADACTDLAGNNNTISNTVNVIYDIVAPDLNTVTIASDNTHSDYVGIGGKVTLSIIASEGILLNPGDVTIAGQTALLSGAGVSWSAWYIMQGTDTEGNVDFEINYSDLAGNAGAPVVTTTNTSSVTFDISKPVLTTVNITSSNIPTSGTKATVGDLITVAFTAGEKVEAVTATIKGKTATVTNTDVPANKWEATYTMSSGDSEIPSNVGFVLNFKDYAGNTADPVSATTDASLVTFDKTKPTLSGVSIISSNAIMPSRAKSGHTVTVTFTGSETLQTPEVTIIGHVATVSNISGNQWKGEYTLDGSEPEGQVSFFINFADAAGNQGVSVNTVNDGSSVSIDNTIPILTSINITSNNANSSRAIVGNTVTLSFTSNETIQNPVVTIAGKTASVSNAGGNSWTANYTFLAGDPEGIVAFVISFQDMVSNAGALATSSLNGSSVTFDETAPSLSPVSISSNNTSLFRAKVGNTITVAFTSSETILTPTATIFGRAATVENVSGNQWKAYITALVTDTEGEILFSISFADIAGNNGVSVSTTTNASILFFDRTNPILTAVDISSNHSNSNFARVGSTVSLMINANESLSNITTAINGMPVTPISLGGDNWVCNYIPSSSDNAGIIPFTISFVDLAGNAGTTVTATTNSSEVYFDKTKPIFNSITISTTDPFTPYVKNGSLVELNFTTNEPTENPNVRINNNFATSITGGPTNWVASRTLGAGEPPTNVFFEIFTYDMAGNESFVATTTTNGSYLIYDNTPPAVSLVSVTAGVYKVGNNIPVFIQADFNNYTGTTVEVNGKPQTLINNNNNTYIINYTVAENDNQINTQASLPINIILQDGSGNATTLSAATADGGSGTITIDSHTPQISSVISNAEVDGILKIGDNLIFTVTPAVAETGLIITPTTYNGKPITWTSATGASYTATYTIAEGDATQDTPLQIGTIGIADVAGNTGTLNNYTGVLKTIYATNPTATILGTTSRCFGDPTVPVTFNLTGYKPFQLTYNDGTAIIGPFSVDAYSYNIDVLSGTYSLVSLVDSTGNLTNSAIQNAIITENALPIVTLNIAGSPFNVNEPRVLLTGFATPSGGIFSGEGVSANGYFYPSMIDVSSGAVNVTITYEYTESINGCKASTNNTVVVSDGGAYLEGLEDTYCNYASEDIITIGNLPEGIDPGSFIVNTAMGWTDNGDNTLTLFPSVIAPGDYQITFQYYVGETLFDTQGVFKIDAASVDAILGLNSEYCKDVVEVSINANGYAPSGGTHHFTFNGPADGFFSSVSSNIAKFYPNNVPADDYLISYYYTSPDLCNSDTIETPVTINPLPIVDLVVQDNYNKDVESYVLEGTPEYVPGLSTVFSNNLGVGISGNLLYPGLIPEGNLKIRYTVSNAEGCTKFIEKDTRILQAKEMISGLENKYCYSTDTIQIECSSSIDPTLVGEFVSSRLGIIPSYEPNKARYIIPDIGNGKDTVRFKYTYVGTPYEVYTSVLVDSIGEVTIQNLLEGYCEDAAQVQINGRSTHTQGTGAFTYSGVSTALTDLQGGFAIFRPSEENVGTENITFTYSSSLSNCTSDTTVAVEIYALPDVSFELPLLYNIDDPAIPLLGVPSGGIFSSTSPGVVGNEFRPVEAGVGDKVITYTYSDGNGCENSTSNTITIIGPSAEITGIPMSGFICLDGEPITLIGSSTNGNPGYFEGDGISNIEPNKASFDPAIAGEGEHTITYKYTSNVDGTTLLYISQTITVDNPGVVEIIGFESLSFCPYKNPFDLNGIPSGGSFIGNFMVGKKLYPSLAEVGNNTVTYSYTSTVSGCSISGSVDFTINPVPDVVFDVSQSCSDLVNDSVQFINNTNSLDEVAEWNWNFGEGLPSTEFAPKHLYTSSGIKPVTLTATTVNNCSSTLSKNITVGILPNSNFTWANECLTETATVLSYKQTGPGPTIKDYKWELSDGTEVSGSSPSLTHLFPNTGDFVAKLTITTVDNCVDSIEKTITIQPIIRFAEIPEKVYYQNFENNNDSWLARAIVEGGSCTWQQGLPLGTIINHAASGEGSAWFTDIPTENKPIESSEVVSPCFDLRTLEKPMIKLNIWSFTETGRDGAVIQYSTDQGVNWENLGSTNKGVNWFNTTTIQSQPGDQFSGWSGMPSTDWQSARVSLDVIKNQPNVRFRVAYASDGNAIADFDGFAFDDFWIGDRQQSVLVEYFTNTNQIAANSNVVTLETQISTDAIPVHYHVTGDPVNNLFPRSSSGREFFYGLSTIPYALANGNSPFNFTTFLENQNIVEVESLQDPKILLGVSYTDGSSDVEITANVTSLVDIDSEDLLLFCAVVQPIVNISTGETYYNVVREFLPNSAGISLQQSWIANESKSFTLTYNPSPEDIANGTRFVVMVQNVATRKVYQSKAIELTLTAKPVSSNSLISTKVFPNPAKHNITVEGSEDIMTVSVIDLSGRTVSITKVNGRQTTIPVEGLSKGVYFMQIDFKNERTVRKFVKQ